MFGFTRKADNDHKAKPREALEMALGTDGLAELEKLIDDEKKIPPKVAVIGKAGVGKTTTINNLFNASWKTSHTIAGTKVAQLKEFDLAGGGTLSVVDMPGLGEDIEADLVYEKIYFEILPTVDVVLWVMQANTRDMAEDQRILREVVGKSLQGLENRIIVGLNQVDKIGPGSWNLKLNYPSKDQQTSINRRCKDISTKISSVTPVHRKNIVYYSALQRYRLHEVLIAIITAAGDLGWKFPVQPKDPFELASPEVQDFVKEVRALKNERRG